MKSIEEYVQEKEFEQIEKEWDIYFNMDDSVNEASSSSTTTTGTGFFGWLARLGKKFWNWLVGKDYSSDNVDWKITKKNKWVDGKPDELHKVLTKNEGLAEHFPKTTRMLDRDNDRKVFKVKTNMNADKTPTIFLIYSDDKDFIKKQISRTYRKGKDILKHYNKIDNPCMLVCFEVSKGNNDDYDDVYDVQIRKLVDEFCDIYDIIFINNGNANYQLIKYLSDDFDLDKTTPIIDGTRNWEDVEDQEENEEQEEETQDKNKKPNEDKPADKNEKPNDNKEDNKEETTPPPLPNTDDGEINIEQKPKEEQKPKTPKNIIEFVDNKTDEIVATAEFSADTATIKAVTGLNIKPKDYYNFVITKLDINDKYSVDNYENVIDDYILPVICNKFGDILKGDKNFDSSKELKIYIKLDGEQYADHIKKLKKLSLTKKIKIKESTNDVFIIIGKTSQDMVDVNRELTNHGEVKNESLAIDEALDIDNLFWMLDTWFANNEQEKTAFMSIVDNCMIKKTYSKNDLGKLCDNINFDIRPFINFISKDATVKDGQKEDFECDYYYELKKIIDVLISNKSTGNKYVRFS